ncbi:tyrosine-type recombinase/integrase [Streptomyces sp. NRRL S-1022]|uniref:tyrosine-type recombinase/integrase n=1 Tax=Streptomyces sp. NRRL S-1022 TaxID=1463880 RepID=UPI000A6C677E|nr:tyrosine-type recombinase/integrase [Streptomyces sp. NRRL S-1022]
MATVTPAPVKDTKGMADPRTVRTALYSWAFNVSRRDEEPPDEVAKVLAWFERKSLPTSSLADRMRVRAALDALTRKLDGTTASASTIRRKRAIFHNALNYAVDAGRLTDNPLPQVPRKAPEQVAEELDPASVPDPRQALALLDAVRTQSARGRRLVAFFGCMYYAAARPAEVIGLRLEDCDLPRRAWGTLWLRETRPRSGSAWTDSGEAHDRRGLKHRPRKAVRTVPIPPDLVSLLRWHITAYGVAPDGRLFRTQRGGLIQDNGHGEVWAEARMRALTPAQQASQLAKRPYDLRHAAVYTWLSSGVEPQVVAARAGHSVAVLFRGYAKCLDGAAVTANARIEQAFENGSWRGRKLPHVCPTRTGHHPNQGETHREKAPIPAIQCQ